MWDRVFERVKAGLGIRGIKTGKERKEVEIFRDFVREQIGEGKECAGLEVLLEEVLVLFTLSRRLFQIMEQEKSVIENGKLLPGIDAWIRMRERLRKVMKELLAAYGGNERDQGKSLAEIMGPILEMGEGVLEDALEFESRTKGKGTTDEPNVRNCED